MLRIKKTRLIKLAAAVLLAVVCAAVLLKYRAFIVATPSMEPEYKVNSIVIAEKGSLGGVKTGDVIVFRSEAMSGRLVCHRAFITENGIITKGDRSKAYDMQAITPDSYVGKCVFHTELLSGYLAKLRTAAGAALYLWMPLLGAALIVGARKFLKRKPAAQCRARR